MIKKLISITLVASLFLFSFVTAASGESEDTLKFNPESFILKSANDTNTIEKGESTIVLEPISPRGLTSDKSKLEKRTQKSKLRGKIKQEKEAGKFLKGVIIPVRVTLNFDTDVELKFEEQIKKNFGDAVKYERVKPREYELIVNTDQLAALEKMDEVLLINDPGEKNEASIGGFIAEDEASVGLNAASEKKARIDFGVTGDLDGDETDYSSDDVVIAVVDTGIDVSHHDLDEGKVIGWFDAVNGVSDPYDDHGHGTHVASIAAGTGDGDPGIQTGFAPGAALVGVKVLRSNGAGSFADIEEGFQWIYDNIDNYSIDVVNMSIKTHASLANCQDVIDLINDIKAEGVPVFVCAGNDCTMPVSGGEIKGLADKILKDDSDYDDIRNLLYENLFKHLKKYDIKEATLTNSRGELEFTMSNSKYKP